MIGYNAALKTVLMSLSGPAFRLLTGADQVVAWRNVELPEVRSARADLLGETSGGDLVHIELQSTNDPEMPFRMLEYAIAIRRVCGRFPGRSFSTRENGLCRCRTVSTALGSATNSGSWTPTE